LRDELSNFDKIQLLDDTYFDDFELIDKEIEGIEL